MLDTDVNWQTAHVPAGEEPELKDFDRVMEELKSAPDYQALDDAGREDVDHVLRQLIEDEVAHGVKTLTPEADAVVARVLNVGKGYLGARDRGNRHVSYSTTAYPGITRSTSENVAGTGAVELGYLRLPEGKDNFFE